MCDKVIILEIKSQYALAMKEGGEVIRIKLKEGLERGMKVYILPEDIYEESPVISLRDSGEKKSKGPAYLRRFAAMAAVLCIIIGAMFSYKAPQACALASIDGNMNIQLELDRNNRVISVSSLDGRLSPESIEDMEGRELSELSCILKELLGPSPVLLACAGYEDGETEGTEQLLRGIFSDNTVLYLSGNSEDIAQAKKSNVSLGFHLASEVISKNDFELLDSFMDAYSEYLDCSDDDEEDEALMSGLEKMSFGELVKVIEANPEYCENEDIMELLADKVEDMHASHRESEGDSEDEEDDDEPEEEEDDD